MTQNAQAERSLAVTSEAADTRERFQVAVFKPLVQSIDEDAHAWNAMFQKGRCRMAPSRAD